MEIINVIHTIHKNVFFWESCLSGSDGKLWWDVWRPRGGAFCNLKVGRINRESGWISYVHGPLNISTKQFYGALNVTLAYQLRHSLSLRIQSECRKIWTSKTPNTDTFNVVGVWRIEARSR